MNISVIDLLALLGIFLIGCGSYYFDPRLLLVYVGLLFLWIARFLAKQEAAKKPAAGEKA